MKVLVFTSLYPNNIWPHHGVFIKERTTHVAAVAGCEVKVVSPVPYFPPFKINYRWWFSQVQRYEVIDGLEVHHPRYFMIPKVGMALHGWLMFAAALPSIRRIYQDFRFDLIDTHYVYPDGLAAVLLGRVFNKPVVVSARGSDINLFQTFPLIRKLLRYTLLRADRVIAVSQALKDAMRQFGVPEAKVAVIPNGVDTHKFFPFPRHEARQQLGLPDHKILLSVGHLTSNKGFDLLVKALHILSEAASEPRLSLVIVGEGAFRKPLEEMIAALHLGHQVHLAGDRPHDELYLWYNAADLFCLASEREGWPNVLLESLACGTPVVATAVGGIPEILRSPEVGFLTEHHERHIAMQISRALKHAWQPDVIVRYAREWTWERAAQSVTRVFATVGSGQRGLPHEQVLHAPTAIPTHRGQVDPWDA